MDISKASNFERMLFDALQRDASATKRLFGTKVKEGGFDLDDLGGQEVKLKDRQARCDNGTLAGAASDLYSDMVNAIGFGIPHSDAILAATMTPAKVLGIDKMTGNIEKEKTADFIVCGDDFDLKQVYISGHRIL